MIEKRGCQMSDPYDPYVAILERHKDWIKIDPARSLVGMFGIQCGPGWAGLVSKLFDDIAGEFRPHDLMFSLLQITEKSGALHICCDIPHSFGAALVVRDAIDLALMRSTQTCRVCGSRGRLTLTRGSLGTLCADHTTARSKLVGSGEPDDDFIEDPFRLGFWRLTYDPDTDVLTRTRITEAEYLEGTKP